MSARGGSRRAIGSITVDPGIERMVAVVVGPVLIDGERIEPLLGR